MTAESSLLPTVILLASGIIGLVASSVLRTSPIIGFFVIGALIGPQCFGLIEDGSHSIYFLGEIGVSFLLFDVGLHLSLTQLKNTWKKFIGIGVLQTSFSSAILFLIMYFFGLDPKSALALSLILSLSSTALVLKLLSDNKDSGSPVGSRATEVLVFQDIVAILLMVIFAADHSQGFSFSTLLEPLVKMILFGTAIILLGKYALKPTFKLLIAVKNDEIFTASALLIVFLSSFITEQLGLSLALGAFLGGLALSESSYAYLIRGEVAPFRSLLLSLFFLSVGINFDLASTWANGPILLTILFAFISAKIVGNYLAFRVLGIEVANASLLASLLAQGSEFAFVLLTTAAASGLISISLATYVSTLVGLSLVVSPFFAMIGCKFSRSVCKVRSEEDPASVSEKEVIIVRIDDFGKQLATLLESEGIPYRAHDYDHDRLSYAESRGLNVYYSDLNRPRTLGRVSLGKALAVVSLVEEDEVLPTLFHAIQKINPDLPLFAATENPKRLEDILDLGVSQTYLKHDNSLIALFESLLTALEYSESDVRIKTARAKKLILPNELFPRNSELSVEEMSAIAA